MQELRRLVIDFRKEASEIVIRSLYRAPELGPNPNTKRRLREVTDLTRRGLEDALEALESGGVMCVGTSGFTQREDVLLAASLASEGANIDGRQNAYER
jgi:hypothetical protein